MVFRAEINNFSPIILGGRNIPIQNFSCP